MNWLGWVGIAVILLNVIIIGTLLIVFEHEERRCKRDKGSRPRE